ncbi:Serine carboxypeptidase-like 28 [Acorus calamus]|uniref:Serine carboxypeptidase-like 28 n=1 Tax=Acorus calamus TaxID=4465 RepID=A0AAV9ENZ1_ACOCL|nr:Serine carboxypeptidase-like 28 [Acorus calamus]
MVEGLSKDWDMTVSVAEPLVIPQIGSKETLLWGLCRASGPRGSSTPSTPGFSYSNTSSDYKGLSDRKISEDNFRFLVNWLERFPEYKERMFFVGGEGYGGIP